MNIIKHRNIPFIISGLLFLTSVVLLVTIGVKPGIDFTGGSLIEVAFTQERPTIQQVEESIATFDLGEVKIQPAGEQNMILRMRFITEDEHQAVLESLRTDFPVTNEIEEEDTSDSAIEITSEGSEVSGVTLGEDGTANIIGETAPLLSVIEERVETIGPSISAHLRERAWEIGLAVIVAIVLYIAYAFRKVSKPVSSWKFGVTAIIALVHDVSIVIGVFVLLGYFFGVEVNIPFVVALLTILGYSVNDTIVVFDRIRENLIKFGYSKYEMVVNKGVNETLVRSFNTSLTTLLVLFALFFFGGETIKYFALALIVGAIAGTYSSIFLASPLLVVWERIGKK
ncbi:protein translocase subunit SecF [Candidatus Peregrinibacteria bacterium]|jgi:preprotein translocase subunit SecF|nr:protein translocase subunit SecF [Candidatus Peregrinibacteria bacterium]